MKCAEIYSLCLNYKHVCSESLCNLKNSPFSQNFCCSQIGIFLYSIHFACFSTAFSALSYNFPLLKFKFTNTLTTLMDKFYEEVNCCYVCLTLLMLLFATYNYKDSGNKFLI